VNRNCSLSLLVAGCVSLTLAGCGGGDDDTSQSTPARATVEQTADPSSDASSAASAASDSEQAEPAGDADCSSLSDDDIAQYLIATQLLAQVSTAEQVASIRDQTVGNYVPADFAAVLVKLRALVGGSANEVFGDPDAALDSWEQANTKMAAMLAAADPTPQEMLDDYVALGDVATKLGWQLPINAPLSEICPDLG